jgi:outer membrane lipoprotein-sorting protein
MPSSERLPSKLVVLFAVIAVVAVGVVALWPTGSTGSPGPIGHNASDQLAALDGLTATVETTVVRGGETNRSYRRVAMRPGTGKVRSVSVSDEILGVDLLVSNGSVTWLYDREANNVTRLDTGSSLAGVNTQGNRIERLFTRLNVSRATVDERRSVPPAPGVAPLPVVPGGQSGPQPSRPSATSFGVTYNGTDTVSGREVYVLSVSSGGGTSGSVRNYTQTLYVDTEWFVPLQTRTAWTSDDQRVVSTTTYRNVTFNPGLDADRFTFDPPANATIETLSTPEIRRYASRAALRANATLSVPEPDLPTTFDFRYGTRTTGNVTSLSLQYTNATAQLTVSKTDFATVNASNGTNATTTDGEKLTVNGRTATYRQIGPSRLISFDCGEYRYSVVGSGISRDLLVRVAASLDC